MAKKFLRGLPYTATATREVCSLLKYLYEFWGYCVNGGASLTVPGGFAATTPSNLPTNCLEGTSVLGSGSDGATAAGSGIVIFTAASTTPFTTSMVGKYITIWKAGSGSSEDAIYQIMGVPSSSTLTLNVNNGGKPDPTTLHPSFTTRTSVNYRIIDAVQASQVAGLAAGQYMVLQLNAAGVNAGQANPQLQCVLRSWVQTGAVLSPGGTWTGSTFTDGTTEQLTTWFAGSTQALRRS